MTTTTARIRRASATGGEAEIAAQLSRELGCDKPALTVLFCAASLDRQQLQTELRNHFHGHPVIGCTTAGELGPQGYAQDSVSGFSFDTEDFCVATATMEQLAGFTTNQAREVIESLQTSLLRQGVQETDDNCFALLLVDGLSMAEEPLCYALQSALGNIPLVGGSAGDGLNFEQTHVLANGEFRSATAVLALVHTRRRFEVFKTQHFSASGAKVVVTGADVERRIVTELNGLPAAEEFAELIGANSVSDLQPGLFAQHPLMLQIGGNWYVRSVQKVNDDGSLTIYCAIDEGLVLTLGRGHNLVEDLRKQFAAIHKRVGEPSLTIACDCILRRLELETNGELGDASAVVRANQITGFSTYGEQFGSIHVNQTLTGIVIA